MGNYISPCTRTTFLWSTSEVFPRGRGRVLDEEEPHAVDLHGLRPRRGLVIDSARGPRQRLEDERCLRGHEEELPRLARRIQLALRVVRLLGLGRGDERNVALDDASALLEHLGHAPQLLRLRGHEVALPRQAREHSASSPRRTWPARQRPRPRRHPLRGRRAHRQPHTPESVHCCCHCHAHSWFLKVQRRIVARRLDLVNHLVMTRKSPAE
ncbi:hypothetical protein T484DRAFT_3402700 [Baffinella frigidus]|nr:hypothetical protein T484DRAFT_3402700 [Cryptophyta sp. CCMP2293]